jgi:hypothetical protein
VLVGRDDNLKHHKRGVLSGLGGWLCFWDSFFSLSRPVISTVDVVVCWWMDVLDVRKRWFS